MLLAQNFFPLVITNLKIISRIGTPLHKLNPANAEVIQVGNEKTFFRKIVWIQFPYIVAMLAQLIFSWHKFPLVTMLQSMTFSASYAIVFLIVLEQYRKRYELASLFNSFVEFEKRHNRKFFCSVGKYIYTI